MIESKPNVRKSFPVTHDLLDAPDGSKIEIKERGGWFERVGNAWIPCDPPVLAAGVVPIARLKICPTFFYCPLCQKQWDRGGHKEGFVKASAHRHVHVCWEIELFKRGYTIGPDTVESGEEAIPIARSHPRMVRAIKANIRRRRRDIE